jgi:hypothetical protein
MAGCCGGKNAGKRISWGRYLLGLGFFTAYHAAVHTSLVGASLVSRRFAPVREFHQRYFRHLLREASAREGIHVGHAAAELDDCRIPE